MRRLESSGRKEADSLSSWPSLFHPSDFQAGDLDGVSVLERIMRARIESSMRLASRGAWHCTAR